ncbi:MAG: hypothetical protein LBB88_08425, partial [Planctomycetaceae bacterium]|nr:hypothetical protein [Planctomycetaceae bacterium]
VQSIIVTLVDKDKIFFFWGMVDGVDGITYICDPLFVGKRFADVFHSFNLLLSTTNFRLKFHICEIQIDKISYLILPR